MHARTLTLIRADLNAQRRHAGRILPVLFPNVVAAVVFRIASGLRAHRLRIAGSVMSAIGQLLTGAEISSQAIIGGGLCLAHTGGVVIGPGVRAGNNLTVYSGVTIGSLRFDSRSGRPSGFPTIGEGATLYTKSSVLGPITLGDRVIVGAHALVMSDGPDAGVAIGVPARWS